VGVGVFRETIFSDHIAEADDGEATYYSSRQSQLVGRKCPQVVARARSAGMATTIANSYYSDQRV
jgi:hypothetical protein